MHGDTLFSPGITALEPNITVTDILQKLTRLAHVAELYNMLYMMQIH